MLSLLHRIDPPAELAAQHTSHQTEAIDEDVVTVIFPKDTEYLFRSAQ